MQLHGPKIYTNIVPPYYGFNVYMVAISAVKVYTIIRFFVLNCHGRRHRRLLKESPNVSECRWHLTDLHEIRTPDYKTHQLFQKVVLYMPFSIGS